MKHPARPDKPGKDKQPAGQRAHPGDHVFFHHDEAGPLSGHVLCCGKHGATVKDADGNHHKVRWERLLGHKKRADRSAKVIDEGEDGSICEDQDGRRFYLHGELPRDDEPGPGADAPADEPDHNEDDDMKKSLILFTRGEGREALLKARANAAGLALQEVTDKAGHQTKRWKKTNPDEDKGRDRQAGANDDHHQEARQKVVGKVVPFTAGSFKGKGEVTAAGKDGVTVKDDAGREHQVHWHELHAGEGQEQDGDPDQEKGQAEGAAETDQRGEAEPAEADKAPDTGGGGGDDGGPWGGQPLFDEKEMSLPKDAAQPWDSEEALYQNADEAHGQFTSWLKGVGEGLGIEHVEKKMDEVDWDNEKGGMLFIAPLKGKERANEKVHTPVEKDGYGGDWTKLLDVVRGTIAVDSLEDVKKVVGKLKETGMELARAPKDRFTKATPVGYRDIMMNVKLPNGMVAELQVNVKSMLAAKEEGHKPYEVMRSILAKDDPSDADNKAYQEAWEQSQKIYGDAWAKVTGSGGEQGGEAPAEEQSAGGEENGKETMQKSHRDAIILVWGKRRRKDG